jgi:hypothetical protein
MEEIETDIIQQVPDVKHILRVASINFQGQTSEVLAEEAFTRNIDVVAFQGCTRQNYEQILRSFKSRGYNYYHKFDQAANVDDAEIIVSRKKVLKKEFASFVNTLQNRGIGKFLIDIGDKPNSDGSLTPITAWVITAQFEKGASGNARRRLQIQELSNLIKRGDVPTIFMGDTHIPSWQQDLKCPNAWLDAWREKGTPDNEKTDMIDRRQQIWYLTKKGMECSDFSYFGSVRYLRGASADFLFS